MMPETWNIFCMHVFFVKTHDAYQIITRPRKLLFGFFGKTLLIGPPVLTVYEKENSMLLGFNNYQLGSAFHSFILVDE